jgi:hypothetical protein
VLEKSTFIRSDGIQNSRGREFGRVLEMAVEDDREEMARKELDCDKEAPCVNGSYSETAINPLPGCD